MTTEDLVYLLPYTIVGMFTFAAYSAATDFDDIEVGIAASVLWPLAWLALAVGIVVKIAKATPRMLRRISGL